MSDAAGGDRCIGEVHRAGGYRRQLRVGPDRPRLRCHHPDVTAHVGQDVVAGAPHGRCEAVRQPALGHRSEVEGRALRDQHLCAAGAGSDADLAPGSTVCAGCGLGALLCPLVVAGGFDRAAQCRVHQSTGGPGGVQARGQNGHELPRHIHPLARAAVDGAEFRVIAEAAGEGVQACDLGGQEVPQVALEAGPFAGADGQRQACAPGVEGDGDHDDFEVLFLV